MHNQSSTESSATIVQRRCIQCGEPIVEREWVPFPAAQPERGRQHPEFWVSYHLVCLPPTLTKLHLMGLLTKPVFGG